MRKKIFVCTMALLAIALFVLPVFAGNNPHGASCILPRDCASGLCRLSVERGGMRCAAADGSVAKYGACWFDAECGWGKCQKVSSDNYICGCTGDDSCASNEWCDNSLTIKCWPGKASGDTCNRKRQCQSSECQLCPTFPGLSMCAGPATKNLGGSCLFDRDCKVGKCSGNIACVNGECVCAQDSDCPSGQRCDKGKLGIGQNRCMTR